MKVIMHEKVLVKKISLDTVHPHRIKDIQTRMCVKPTATLTKGQLYSTILLKEQFRPRDWGHHGESAYRDMIGVVNDNNQYIEVAVNRFIDPKIKPKSGHTYGRSANIFYTGR